MSIYAMLSQLSPEAFRDPKDFKKLADDVSTRIKREFGRMSAATGGQLTVQVLIEDGKMTQIGWQGRGWVVNPGVSQRGAS